MRQELRDRDFTSEEIEAWLKKEKKENKDKKDKKEKEEREDDKRQVNERRIASLRPTYIKVHTKHLLPETLDAYELPWSYDVC